jgi:hypothetical protein
VGDHLGDAARADDVCALCFAGQKFVHAGGGAIVSHDSVAVVVHIENEIPAHYSQSDESDIALGFHYFESHGVCEARTITKSGDG